ncbi:MAG: hypothetical protein DRI01_10200 [Chloroflexi bacterium]|mgnify:CR=1 FL=1|nr:MAG: hypothetical protein DRI01_10200 [Chloroflexota bacterium]
MNKQRFTILVLLISLAMVSALSIVRISAASPLAPANAPTQLVGFSAANYSVGEAEGTTTITITLDAASSLTVTVDYATSDNTALAGSDYLTASGVLTFTPGVASQTFTVSILDDTLEESDETITLTLSNPTNGTLRIPESATLTILDDDNYIYLPLVMRNAGPPSSPPVLDDISNPDGMYNYTVSWSAVNGATSYTLEEDDNGAFSSPDIAYSGPNTSMSVYVRDVGTYYYHVKAVNDFGSSDWSNVQSVVVTVQPTGPEPGHYTGTSSVSFDVTEGQQVCSFDITACRGIYCCRIRPASCANITDNDFAFSRAEVGAIYEITGTFDAQTHAVGTYFWSWCEDILLLTPAEGTWEASK